MTTTKEIYGENEIPKEHLKEIKKFSGAHRFVAGRIDEFNTIVSVWEHGGAYKIIRTFKLGKGIVVSVDADMLNIDNAMAKLLMEEK